MATITISGSDSNLGTITSNISYSVTTDSGNPISLTRVVNSVQVASQIVTSGFNYSIPITDLPTGTNTVQIVATTSTTSGNISATRTWTYYKTPINIPSTGGIAQLTQNGQNIWPVTVPDAVEAPVYLGGNLNAALNKLGQAALYTAPGKPLYNQVDINLANVSVGDEVSLPYNGVMVPHIVVQIGNPDTNMYDESCNGVWLLRKNLVASQQWNSSNVNNYAISTINTTYLPNVVLPLYDITVQNAIQEVKIPYVNGTGDTGTVSNGANGLSCKIFLLSGYEVGLTIYDSNLFPIDGAKLSYFESGTGTSANNKREQENKSWWLRSPMKGSNSAVWHILPTGGFTTSGPSNNTVYVRPAFIMPTTFTATYYVDSNNNVMEHQLYSTSGAVTDVFGYEVPISQYEVGTYVGTGTFGPSNPTSITTTSVPKFICITNTAKPYVRAILPYGGYGFIFNVNTATSIAISAYGLNTTWSSTGVSWYNTANAQLQLNESGVTYRYVIFS